LNEDPTEGENKQERHSYASDAQLVRTKTICKRLELANKRKTALIEISAIKSRSVSVYISYIRNSIIDIY